MLSSFRVYSGLFLFRMFVLFNLLFLVVGFSGFLACILYGGFFCSSVYHLILNGWLFWFMSCLFGGIFLYPEWLVLFFFPVCLGLSLSWLVGSFFYPDWLILLVCILNGWGFFSILMVNFFVLYPDWLGFFLYHHG